METKIPQTKQEAFAQLDEMLSEEDVNRLAKVFRADYIVFDPDGLSGKIIESYQRYLKRKRV